MAGGIAWQVPHAVGGGGGVQDCVSTGEPPVQPEGDEDVTVRVWVPPVEQALQVE